MNLKTHKHFVICPEYASRDIHMEYESYGCNYSSNRELFIFQFILIIYL
jgi:hypothetical protein